MLNKYNYSQINLNAGNTLKNLQLKYSNINSSKINSNKSFSQNIIDNISYGAGKQFASARELLSTITKVNNQEIKQLTANNNVLDFKTGSYYKTQTSSGLTAIFTGGNSVYMPYSDLNLGTDFALAPSDYKEIEKAEKLFTYLGSDKTGFCARTSYSNTEIKNMLGSVGIKPGFFEVKNDTKANKFYMLDDGTIYPEYQVEAHRQGFNQTNWFKDGYTKNSSFLIDGKEYKLDDNGHLNIPEGTATVMENIKIKK